MKINYGITNYTTNNINNTNIKNNLKQHNYISQPMSFGISAENGFKLSKKLNVSLHIQKFLAKLVGQSENVKYYEMGLLEGLQEGIDVFKGLKMKDIAFLGEDLHTITAKRGCYSHCAYCYTGAKKPVKSTQSTINSILFEDLKSISDGFKALRKRSGINFVHNNSNTKYQTIVFDSDNIDVTVADLKGKIHEFPEINKMLYDATGIKGVFDTSGWAAKSKKHQERAEKIVQYYSKPERMEELLQFNISINPFHSTLVKVNELKQKGRIVAAKNIYDKHVERLANALFTCIPISTSEKFNTINRAFSDDIPNMNGFYIDDEMELLTNVFNKLKQMCIEDLNTNKKYIHTKTELEKIISIFAHKLRQEGEPLFRGAKVETDLLVSEPLEKLIKEKNPQMNEREFYKHFKMALHSEEAYERMQYFKKYRAAGRNYEKIIDANGKVYLTDAYRVIPTDIQLNFLNKNKETKEFSTVVKDFVLTEKMR